MTRSIETAVTFRRPFTLAALDGVQPAGTYRLVEEQEEIAGLSFLAFRRIATWLHVPANPAPGDTCQVVPILPDELAEVLAADAA
jgi:hypothetical protein